MMAFLGAKLQNDESRAILGAMFEARAEYLQKIQKQYGSVEAYAEESRLYERVVRGNESVIAGR